MHVSKTDILFNVKQGDIKIIYASYDIGHEFKGMKDKKANTHLSTNKKSQYEFHTGFKSPEVLIR